MLLKLPGLDSGSRNSHSDNGDGIHQETLSHALPTFQTGDPDLDLIMGVWDRLASEIKARLIEMVRANLATESTERTITSES